MEVATVRIDQLSSIDTGLPAALVNKIGHPEPAALTSAHRSGISTIKELSTATTSTETRSAKVSKQLDND